MRAGESSTHFIYRHEGNLERLSYLSVNLDSSFFKFCPFIPQNTRKENSGILLRVSLIAGKVKLNKKVNLFLVLDAFISEGELKVLSNFFAIQREMQVMSLLAVTVEDH